MPTRCIASRSAVMPLLERLPLSGNQYTQGLADDGGLAKPRARSSTDAGSAPAFNDAARKNSGHNLHMMIASLFRLNISV